MAKRQPVMAKAKNSNKRCQALANLDDNTGSPSATEGEAEPSKKKKRPAAPKKVSTPKGESTSQKPRKKKPKGEKATPSTTDAATSCPSDMVMEPSPMETSDSVIGSDSVALPPPSETSSSSQTPLERHVMASPENRAVATGVELASSDPAVLHKSKIQEYLKDSKRKSELGASSSLSKTTFSNVFEDYARSAQAARKDQGKAVGTGGNKYIPLDQISRGPQKTSFLTKCKLFPPPCAKSLTTIMSTSVSGAQKTMVPGAPVTDHSYTSQPSQIPLHTIQKRLQNTAAATAQLTQTLAPGQPSVASDTANGSAEAKPTLPPISQITKGCPILSLSHLKAAGANHPKMQQQQPLAAASTIPTPSTGRVKFSSKKNLIVLNNATATAMAPKQATSTIRSPLKIPGVAGNGAQVIQNTSTFSPGSERVQQVLVAAPNAGTVSQYPSAQIVGSTTAQNASGSDSKALSTVSIPGLSEDMMRCLRRPENQGVLKLIMDGSATPVQPAGSIVVSMPSSVSPAVPVSPGKGNPTNQPTQRVAVFTTTSRAPTMSQGNLQCGTDQSGNAMQTQFILSGVSQLHPSMQSTSSLQARIHQGEKAAASPYTQGATPKVTIGYDVMANSFQTSSNQQMTQLAGVTEGSPVAGVSGVNTAEASPCAPHLQRMASQHPGNAACSPEAAKVIYRLKLAHDQKKLLSMQQEQQQQQLPTQYGQEQFMQPVSQTQPLFHQQLQQEQHPQVFVQPMQQASKGMATPMLHNYAMPSHRSTMQTCVETPQPGQEPTLGQQTLPGCSSTGSANVAAATAPCVGSNLPSSALDQGSGQQQVFFGGGAAGTNFPSSSSPAAPNQGIGSWPYTGKKTSTGDGGSITLADSAEPSPSPDSLDPPSNGSQNTDTMDENGLSKSKRARKSNSSRKPRKHSASPSAAGSLSTQEPQDGSESSLDSHASKVATPPCHLAEPWAEPLTPLWQEQVVDQAAERRFNRCMALRFPHCTICALLQPYQYEQENSRLTSPKLSEPLVLKGKDRPLPQRSVPSLPESCFLSTESPSTSTADTAKLSRNGQSLLLVCQDCQVCVHSSCYGVDCATVVEKWKCARCAEKQTAAECALCFLRGGALKPTTDGRWAHIVCALAIAEVKFEDVLHRSPIDITAIQPARFKLKCLFCTPLTGHWMRPSACIQCCSGRCVQAFHVTCAYAAGMIFEKRQPPMPLHVTCPKHAFQRHKAQKSRELVPVKEGDKVFAKHKNGRYYSVEVTDVREETFYAVDFDDGSVSTDLYPVDIEGWNCEVNGPPPLGQAVQVRWVDDQLYGGIFRGTNSFTQYTVEFEDGTVQSLKRQEIWAEGEKLPKHVQCRLSTATERKFDLFYAEEVIEEKRRKKPKVSYLDMIKS